MKFKSLLSVVACGLASQFMMGCGASGKYYDFGTPAMTYHKAAPAPATPTPVIEEAPAAPVAAAAAAAAAPVLEANAAQAVASARVARTAPLTTPAVERAVASNSTSNFNALSKELAAAKTKKDIKIAAKKIKREVKEAKASGLNYYVKMGLILLIAGALVAAIGLGLIGSLVAIIGLVLILLGLLEM